MHRQTLRVAQAAVIAALSGALSAGQIVPDKAAAKVASDPSAVIGEDSMPRPYMRVTKTVRRGIRDDNTLDGYASSFASTDRNWLIQWHWNIERVLPGVAYTAYARVKASKAGAGQPKIRGGVYDGGARKVMLSFTGVSLAEAPDGRWFFLRLGEISPADAQFLWMSGDADPSDNDRSTIFFDRFILIPKFSGAAMAKIARARQPDSGLSSFCLDARGAAQIVYDFNGAPAVTLHLLSVLGGAGSVSVTACGGRDGGLDRHLLFAARHAKKDCRGA